MVNTSTTLLVNHSSATLYSVCSEPQNVDETTILLDVIKPKVKNIRSLSTRLFVKHLPIVSFLFAGVTIALVFLLATSITRRTSFYPLPSISFLGDTKPASSLFSWGMMMTSFFYYTVVFFKYMQLGYQLRSILRNPENQESSTRIVLYRVFRMSVLVFGMLAGLFLGILSCVGENTVSTLIHDASAGSFFVAILLHMVSMSIVDIVALKIDSKLRRGLAIGRIVITVFQAVMFVNGLVFFILKDRSPILYSIAAVVEYIYIIGCLTHMVTFGIEFGDFDFTFRVTLNKNK